ncbi:hypothetical protein B2J93_6576 [Marssonina coronariae]|uniref:Uncharacterized protein n=1 Tax=Diplocarpon coronariae TaxID=2795749 RepID=A0A218Z1K9_9HELO|nr:hypothetical protein B2J93_6576 [Marssonina coronariae]
MGETARVFTIRRRGKGSKEVGNRAREDATREPRIAPQVPGLRHGASRDPRIFDRSTAPMTDDTPEEENVGNRGLPKDRTAAQPRNLKTQAGLHAKEWSVSRCSPGPGEAGSGDGKKGTSEKKQERSIRGLDAVAVAAAAVVVVVVVVVRRAAELLILVSDKSRGMLSVV